ncbi:hypothetical protein DSO57_1005895 [Entomophthora muscae]|uniref:Uncharacterized protein n=1 Tax=Entomophthora muscae TaxID=34485 RepID=A0ACC2S9W9_9FUNG|nr:hypothetical protein DSO57_1005895 [Entomophthora muscae]
MGVRIIIEDGPDITGFSLFAMLYRREATTHSLLGMQLSTSDATSNPEEHIKGLVNCIKDIQAFSYASDYEIKALELTPRNSGCATLPEFQVEDLVLYY